MASKRTGRVGNSPVKDFVNDVIADAKELIPGKRSKRELARAVAEGWHGRKAKSEFTIVEVDKYPTDLAQLGILVELAIVVPDSDDAEVLPIAFTETDYPDEQSENVLVCSTPDRKQLVFVGGDQEIDEIEVLEELQYDDDEIETLVNRHKVVVGEVYSITYFADKHHLTGPKAQKNGVPYEHKFGEMGGVRPIMVYDTQSKKVELVGGSYEIRDEGIYN